MIGAMTNDLIDGSLDAVVQLTHIALLSGSPRTFPDIARLSLGDTALSSSNFEIKTEGVARKVKVKSIPTLTIGGTTGQTVTAKYVALYTDSNHWISIDTNNKDYLVGATARINDFDIDLSYPATPLKMNDKFMDGGPDKIKNDTKQMLVMSVVPAQSTDITAANTLTTIALLSTDFTQSGAGGSRKMAVAQKLSAALTKSGTIKAVVLRKDANNTEWLSTTVNNVTANAGDTVQVNTWDIKFIPTTSSVSDKPKADSADLTIDAGNPLAEDIAYFTIDFEHDLVTDQNPQAIFADEKSEIDGVSRDLVFADYADNHYYFGDVLDTGYLSADALSVMLKITSDFKSTGDLFSIGAGFYLQLGDRISSPSALRFGDDFTVEIPSLSDGRFDEGAILAVTYGDGEINIYVDGARVVSQRVGGKRELSGGRAQLGGKTSFAGTVEFAAIWNRELTGSEVKTMSNAPYLMVIHKPVVPPEIVVIPGEA